LGDDSSEIAQLCAQPRKCHAKAALERFRFGCGVRTASELNSQRSPALIRNGKPGFIHWAHDNPTLELRGSDFTNDPRVIGDNHRMVSVNSALAVDLTGQVAADTLGGKFYSGIGGQVDFVRGASKSPGGRSIIALRSTAKGDSISRICATLGDGSGVVTSRGDVRYVVTEYGVADLWGRSVRERALALIEIAHPRFRSELLVEAKRRHYAVPDQHTPTAIHPWQTQD
jgi:acyl-CoA hydrolase